MCKVDIFVFRVVFLLINESVKLPSLVAVGALERNLQRVGIDVKDNFRKIMAVIENRRDFSSLSAAEKRLVRQKIFILLNGAKIKKDKKSITPFTAIIGVKGKEVETFRRPFSVLKNSF